MIFGLGAAGCVSRAQQLKPTTLRIGIVDMDRVIMELPKYHELSDRYLQERAQMFREIGNDPDAMKKFLADEKKKEEIEHSVQKWDDERRKFLDQANDDLREAASQVARDKGIDIVLVNAPWHPVYQRMAVDITTDVIFVLRESGKTVH